MRVLAAVVLLSRALAADRPISHMPKLHFQPEARAALVNALNSERVLAIYRAGLPSNAVDAVCENGYVEGTLKHVAKYLVTLVVPIQRCKHESPDEFLARQAQYESGAKDALFSADTSQGDKEKLGKTYDDEFKVC